MDTLKRIGRQLLFILFGTVLRFPIWGVLWILGRLGLMKVLFLVYPADISEAQGFCPNLPLFRRFFSGRPTLGGFITQGMRPIGIYVVTPDTVLELANRRSRHLAHGIVHRLLWIARLIGARSVGLAGQLSFIFENKHGIPIVNPLQSSLYGSVFSLSETIAQSIQMKQAGGPHAMTIGILGKGAIETVLSDYLVSKYGWKSVHIEVKYLRNGTIGLKNESEAIHQLQQLDLLVNMMPTGRHFLQTDCHRYLSPDCVLVDFSHPGIDADIPHRRVMGNRIHRDGLRFFPSLPGDWTHRTIPACSLASLLAIEQKSQWQHVDEFCNQAKQSGFFVSLSRPGAPYKKAS